MYLAVGLAAVCLLTAVVNMVFPLWLGLALLASIAISMFFRPKADMRGSNAIDLSGSAQIQSLITVNLTIGVWLVQVLVVQLFFA